MEDGKGEGGKCSCGCCGCCGGGSAWGMYGGHHHGVGHMIAKILIVVFVFWAGVQFGKLETIADARGALFERGYGPSMMGGYYYSTDGANVGYGPGMMIYRTTTAGTTTK